MVGEDGDYLFLEGVDTTYDKATVGRDCKLAVTGICSKAHKYRLCLFATSSPTCFQAGGVTSTSRSSPARRRVSMYIIDPKFSVSAIRCWPGQGKGLITMSSQAIVLNRENYSFHLSELDEILSQIP